MKTYAVLAALMIVFRIIEGVYFVHVSRIASRTLHDTNFVRVMNGTLSYFDTTPLGRVLNRFSGVVKRFVSPLGFFNRNLRMSHTVSI